jgi:D-beta-D-heptose 7-phosphate kinase / D-beta-D-heptose 1-phosphate adenosyltransferase
MAETSLVDRLKGAKVAVVGDVILDNHVYGRVSRVSDEAPVPVLHVRDERAALGGAANVAANIAALGGQARLIGVIGEDQAGARVAALIGDYREAIDPRLTADRSRPTTAKTRYLGGQQQVVRVDREATTPIAGRIEDDAIEDIAEAAADCAVLIVSDYRKGVMTDRVIAALLAAAHKHARPVIVDSKRADMAIYRGAAYIAPNRRELTAAVGLPCETDEEAAAAAAALIARTDAGVLLTRSEKGMSLFRKDAAALHFAAEARDVFDVSGAGDTVTGVFALGLAAQLPIEQALRVANAAAGVVVGHAGTVVVMPGELRRALGARAGLRPAGSPPAATALPVALAQRRQWAAEGLVVGFTNGCFDLLHPGHVSLLAQASAACDKLIVALNSDESVRRLKGADRPIQDLDSRAAVVGAIRGVDLVVAFAEDTPLELIRALEPDLLVKGADYSESAVVGADLVKARGGRVLLANLEPGQSSSVLVKRAGGTRP